MPAYQQRPEPSSEERGHAVRMAVWFDGRYYRYDEFRYDRLSDAVAYAELSRSVEQSAFDRRAIPVWQSLVQPTDAEQKSMTHYSVTFDGIAYHVDGYRYDRLSDALNQAERHV